jgi:hypothetical protein
MKTTKVSPRELPKKVMLINRSCASSILQRRGEPSLPLVFNGKGGKFIQFSFFFLPLRTAEREDFPFPHFCVAEKRTHREKKVEIFSHFAAGLCATNVLVFFPCDGE